MSQSQYCKVYEQLLKRWANYCYESNGDDQQLGLLDHWCQILSDADQEDQIKSLFSNQEFLNAIRMAELHDKNNIGQTKQSSL
jgi:hypothetical protein